MKVLVANLASPANPGDQAIFRGALKLLRNYYGHPEITVVTRAISERSAYEALGCRAVSNYPDVEYLATDSVAQKLMNVPRALLAPGPLIQAVRSCDVVFLIGGAYFYSYRPGMPGLTYASHFTAGALAKLFGKPVIFLPQSYGPFISSSSQWMFDRAVKDAGFIFYREEITGEWMRKRYPAFSDKYAFMPDLAFNLEMQDVLTEAIQRPEKPRVGVTIRAWKAGGKDQHDYLPALEAFLLKLHQQHGFCIRVIVQVQDAKKGEGDEWISEELANRLRGKVEAGAVEFCTHRPYYDLPDICRLYRECDLLIGMRLHSALLSFVVGRPALVVGYQHKAEGILKRMGLGELYLGSFETLTPERFQAAFDEVWRNRENWTKKIKTVLEEARTQIRQTFEMKMKRFQK